MDCDEALNWIVGICLATALVLNGTPMRPHLVHLALHMPESRGPAADSLVASIWCAEDPTGCADLTMLR
jgi:hypothetical protein